MYGLVFSGFVVSSGTFMLAPQNILGRIESLLLGDFATAYRE
jgi:hypothetical protein